MLEIRPCVQCYVKTSAKTKDVDRPALPLEEHHSSATLTTQMTGVRPVEAALAGVILVACGIVMSALETMA